MTRSLLRFGLKDDAGNAIQNALLYLYLEGTTTPVADAWTAKTGGLAVTTAVTDPSGQVEVWFDTPKNVDIKVTDNADAAYLADTGTGQSWSEFTKRQPVTPSPDEILFATVTSRRAGQVPVVPSTGNGLKWAFGVEWLDPRDGDGEGNNTVAAFDGVTDVTAAVNACIARVPLGTGGHIFWPGAGVVSSMITIDQRRGLIIQGDRWWKSQIIPTAALVGSSVIRFQNYERSGLRDLWVLGSTGSPPTYCVEFRENHGVDPTLAVATAGELSNCRFGSNSASSVVNPIGFTTAGLDQNNDLCHILEPQCNNYTGAAIKITHSNALLHNVIGGQFTGPKGVEMAGGSVTLIGTRLLTSSWMIDMGAGTYYHASIMSAVTSEGSGPWFRSNVAAIGNVEMRVQGTEIASGTPALTVVDWKSPGSIFAATNCDLLTGQAGTIMDFGTDSATFVQLMGNKIDVGEIRYGGKLVDSGNSDQTGSVVYTPQAGARRSSFARNNGGGQFQTLEFAHGSTIVKLFMDTATGEMKVTDAGGTRVV